MKYLVEKMINEGIKETLYSTGRKIRDKIGLGHASKAREHLDFHVPQSHKKPFPDREFWDKANDVSVDMAKKELDLHSRNVKRYLAGGGLTTAAIATGVGVKKYKNKKNTMKENAIIPIQVVNKTGNNMRKYKRIAGGAGGVVALYGAIKGGKYLKSKISKKQPNPDEAISSRE